MAKERVERDEEDLVRLYLTDIGQYPLLTKDDEVRLAQAIENGNAAREEMEAAGKELTAARKRELRRLSREGERAERTFVQSNLRLVVSIAKKYQASGLPLLDLIQEGNLGLMHAVEKFDWRKGFKFSTYATWWIRQAITRGIANTGRTIRLPVHAGDTLARLQKARSRLELKLGRPATLSELAKEVEMPEDKVTEALRFAAEPLSLSEPLREDGDAELGDVVFLATLAAESPNPIVNHLVIMPDIEKRLESFVRLGHGIIVFPGGVGTCEEILYLLGILLREENSHLRFPFILTGPTAAAPYFEQIDKFIRLTLGDEAANLYQIIVADPAKVAKTMDIGILKVKEQRIAQRDSFFFNWALHVPLDLQQPFVPTHELMAGLDLHHGRKPHELAADLRRAFSGIVAGNVKEDGMRRIEAHGPFEIHGDPDIMQALDALLRAFVQQRRMKISGDYKPCYKVVG